MGKLKYRAPKMTPDQIFEEIRKIESLGRYTIVLSENQCQIWEKEKHNQGLATGLIIDADFCDTLQENAADCMFGAYEYLLEKEKIDKIEL